MHVHFVLYLSQIYRWFKKLYYLCNNSRIWQVYLPIYANFLPIYKSPFKWNLSLLPVGFRERVLTAFPFSVPFLLSFAITIGFCVQGFGWVGGDLLFCSHGQQEGRSVKKRLDDQGAEGRHWKGWSVATVNNLISDTFNFRCSRVFSRCSDILIDFSQKWRCPMKILLKLFFSNVKYLHQGGVRHTGVSINISKWGGLWQHLQILSMLPAWWFSGISRAGAEGKNVMCYGQIR